jgi:hypothetical protein
MIDRALLPLLAGCAIFGTVILLEINATDSHQPEIAPPAPRAEIGRQPRTPALPLDEMAATAAARPLFSPNRRPAEKTSSTSTGEPELNDVRLTGIVVEPDRHMAIFAVAGAKPLVRSEGESVKEWRLDSISPNEVSLSGPGGSRTLAPKTDPNLVRPMPQAVVQPGAAASQAANRAGQPAAVAQPVPGRPAIPVASPVQPAPAAQPRPAPAQPAARASGSAPNPLRAPTLPRPPQ